MACRAIEKCLEQASFDCVKFLTTDTSRPYAVKIPPLNGLEAYSNFMTRELWKHVHTSHCLVVQWDGYLLDSGAWTPAFLDYDFIGAPFQPSKHVGNGGFSLRSRKLLAACARVAPGESTHPEDSWISLKQRNTLKSFFGIRFADFPIASQFAFEGRAWGGREWHSLPIEWRGQLGFHSFLTVLPYSVDRPLVFHHSGDAGDVIYALPVMAALGGGVLFLSGDNRFPYPRPTRWQTQGAPPNWCGNLASLLNVQPYIWNTMYTHGLPFSTDVDFNSFRAAYNGKGTSRFASLFELHQKPFGVTWPEDKPWLVVDREEHVEGRPIVVNRTERFHNDAFPWHALVDAYGDKMVFVGDPLEYGLWRQTFGAMKVPHQKTSNLLEVARLIAGAKVFIGNQSCPLAIAHGLGKRVIVEEWQANPNCALKRPDAIYVKGNTTHVPEHWLE